jgi:hypothetical protein
MGTTEKSGLLFPPYGVLNQDEAASNDHLIPIDWLPLATDPGYTFNEKWELWLSAVIRQINDVIWPSWDPDKSRWEPCRSLARMEELTRADFKVFEQMDVERVNRGLDQLPEVPNRAINIFSQRQLFVIEDNRSLDGGPVIPFASYYNTYDTRLAPELASAVAPLWFNSTHHKLRHTQYRVKVALQRPRAYQTAMLLGYPNFVNEVAVTGLTPSACSGHCLQGLTGMGGVVEFFRKSGVDLDPDNLEAMMQYAVDIGDRRVMAGVHYPSDNLSSWIILMNLADRVYRDPFIKCFLWKAIKKHSFVYSSILKCAATPEGEALRLPLSYLQSLAPRDCAKE